MRACQDISDVELTSIQINVVGTLVLKVSEAQFVVNIFASHGQDGVLWYALDELLVNDGRKKRREIDSVGIDFRLIECRENVDNCGAIALRQS